MAYKVKTKKVKTAWETDEEDVAKLFEKKKVLGVVSEGTSESYTVWYRDK